jgi:subtilase family serine protease
LIVTAFIPIFPRNDPVLENVFLSTQGEVIARVANQPAGGGSGSVTCQVFADGVLVATRSESIPHGSQAFWSGYKVLGQQTIRVVLDSDGQYWEANEGNNEKTKTCNAASSACW